MDSFADSITERFRAGADPATMFFSLLPDSHRLALRRCAALRSFDHAIYAGLLCPPGGPELEALLAADEIRPLRRAPHRYRVAASFRRPAFTDWWTTDGRVPLEPPVPAELRDLARATASHSLAAGRSVDALDQLLLGDPDAARSLFQRLYQQADEVHDLPACRVLLEVLEAPTRLTLLGADLLRLYHEHRSYLAARTLWRAEYNQSERYLRRPRLEQALEELLDGSKGRVLQLLGRGGMGKTMQLRWLISRRCIRAPGRVPCARIDFDSVMLTVATRDPWLLLTDIAAQLDGQFGTAPFQDLLASYGDYRILLRRSADASGSVEIPVQADGLDSEDVLTRFTQTLAEAAGDRQVVLVFDTTEELLLRPGSGPAGLLGLLQRVHDSVAQVRIVLAGREDLLGKPGSPMHELPGRSVDVDHFDVHEQLCYLRDIRQLPAGELVDAIVRHSGGTPFTVAVFADLVREDPSLTAADIEQLRDPGLRYVIERVVKRIDDERVRWLLRFGVIPRMLTYGFVVEVLRPFLARALTDASRAQDGNPAAQETWQPGGMHPPETEADLRDLWTSLRTHAGLYSWVWVEGEASDMIRFHPEIVGPLRALLRDEDPDFRPLNLAAADYYERMARQHPAEWPSLIREAVFHRLQVDPATGIESWRTALAEARRLGRPDWAQDVAAELYAGNWLHGEDAAALPAQALAQAYLELARSAADLARAGAGDRARNLWTESQENLSVADALASAHPEVRLPEPTTVVLRAHIAASQGRPDEVIRLLGGHRNTPMPAAEVADVENTLGNALEAAGLPEAADHFRAAFAACDRAGDEAGARRALLNLARERTEHGRADQALDSLRQGQRWLSGTAATLAEAAALGLAGVPLQAAALLARGRITADTAVMRARLLSDAGQHEQAMIAATEALQALAGSTEASADTARILAVRGRAYAAMLDFGPAIDDLLAAGDRARKRRAFDAVAEYAAQRSLIRLFDMGDVRTAAQAADEAMRAQGEPGRRGWLLARIAHAHVLDALARNGDNREAWQVMREIWEVLRESSGTPRSWLRAVIGGLALATENHGSPGAGTATCLSTLARYLAEIRPAAGRFQLLHRLAEAAAPAGSDPADREKLVRLASEPWDTGPAPRPNAPERCAIGLGAAEVLRVAGDSDAAREMLGQVVPGKADEMLWWQWARARERLGPAISGERQPPEWLGLGDRHPGLGAAYLITLACYRRNADPPATTAGRLDKAESLLQHVLTSQRWTARLHEIRAQAASDTGHRDSAQRHAVNAARIWGELGDDRRQVSVGASYELGRSAAELDTTIMELRISRVPSLGTGAQRGISIETVARMPGGREFRQTRPGDDVGDRPEGGSISLRSVVSRLRADPDAWARNLAKAIPAEGRAMVAGSAASGRLDIRLVCDTRETGAAPWELAQAGEHSSEPLVCLPAVATVYRGPPADVRAENHTVALQAILRMLGHLDIPPDGFVGEHTRTALLAFQRQAGLPGTGAADRRTWQALRASATARPRRELRVVVIRPGRYSELIRRRGTTARGGDLAHVYQSAGMQVSVIEDPTPELLRSHAPLLRAGRPDIIHLAGTVLLESESTVMDFGGDAAARSMVKGSAGADQVPVTALGDLLAAAARPSLGPLVILDVPWPGSRSEALRALFVRNSLAHQLSGLGRAVAVIATGLARLGELGPLYELLVGGLAKGLDPAAVARRIQRGSPDNGSPWSHLPFASTALFLQRAPYTLLPLGTS